MFALFLILAIMAILGQAFLISKQKEGFIIGNDVSTLFGGKSEQISGLEHVDQSNIINNDDILKYDVSLARFDGNKPIVQYFDIWHMADEDSVPNTQKIKTLYEVNSAIFINKFPI